MRKLCLLLIALTILTNVSFASFPVAEKEGVEIIQISPISDNLKILLYSLVPIPAAIIGIGFFSMGSVGFVFGVIVGAVAVVSAIYSLYLNFTTDIYYWDWRNYLAVITALVLGLLAFGWTVIIMVFGGIG